MSGWRDWLAGFMPFKPDNCPVPPAPEPEYEMPGGDDWQHVCDPYGVAIDWPQRYQRVEIWRKEWPEARVVNWARDIHPMMNVWGLYWRPMY